MLNECDVATYICDGKAFTRSFVDSRGERVSLRALQRSLIHFR